MQSAGTFSVTFVAPSLYLQPSPSGSDLFCRFFLFNISPGAIHAGFPPQESEKSTSKQQRWYGSSTLPGSTRRFPVGAYFLVTRTANMNLQN
jgi:hypothetical protein